MLRSVPEGPSSLTPLVVLCSHRSGSSLFVSLLVDAGLHVGELLEPASDNRRGFFENRDVVALNKRLLQERDADWTCPPAWLDHRLADLQPLEQVGNELRQTGRPWGFKDPRLLFTLPAWAAAIGECSLVGVHRNSADVARSMVARGGVSFEQATTIADAYAERLAEAHRRFHFPIVSFDAPPARFIERVGALAALAGLDIDEATASAKYEVELVHHRSTDSDRSGNDEYLAQAAELPIERFVSASPDAIIKAWEELPSGLTERLPLELGPTYATRRRNMLRQTLRLLPDVAEVALIEHEERPVHVLGLALRVRSLDATEVDRGSLPDGERHRFSHLVAPNLLDDIAPADVAATLDRIAALLEHKAVVGIGGWMLDSWHAPSSHLFQPAGRKAFTDRPPYLHHLDDVTAALRQRGLHVAGFGRTTGGRANLFITNDKTIGRDGISAPHLREQVCQLTADVARTREALARSTEKLAERNETIRGLNRELAQGKRALTVVTERLTNSTKRLAETNRQSARLTAQVEAVTGRLNVLGEERDQLNRALKAAEASSRRARHAYDRLSRRRSVRLALLLARPVSPAIRMVRALRQRRGLKRGRRSSE